MKLYVPRPDESPARGHQLGEDWQPSRNGLYLPPQTSERWRYGPQPIAISLFSGCGGFDLGFVQAGWRVVAAVEWEPFATLTYMHNLGTYPIQIHYVEGSDKDRLEKALRAQMKLDAKRGDAHSMILSGGGWIKNEPDALGTPHFWFGDIRKITGQQMLDALGLARGELDCVFGGPPCQGFSIAGERDVMDPRNSLVFEFVRLVLEIRPKAMVMENAEGIASMVTPEGVPVVDAICRLLEDGEFGTFDALKRGLLATAGLKPGAVVRHERPAGGKDEATAAQAALF